jgi:hypothetical protein
MWTKVALRARRRRGRTEDPLQAGSTRLRPGGAPSWWLAPSFARAGGGDATGVGRRSYAMGRTRGG